MKTPICLVCRPLPSLAILSLAALLSLSTAPAASDTWTPTTGGVFSWNDSANWLSATQFPNGIDNAASLNIDISAGQAIDVNQAITLGTLNLGDTNNTASFTLNAGTGPGFFIFDVTAGTALLDRTSVNTRNDTINADVVLNDRLQVKTNWVANTNGIIINGLISGAGDLELLANALPASGTASDTQFLDLTNTSNSYTGNTIISNGRVSFRGDVPVSANSALGNSAGAILLTGPNSFPSLSTQSFQNTTPAELRLTASDDSTNYTFARGLDFSTGVGDNHAGRSRFSIYGNGTGDPNTNILTVSGNITLGSNARRMEFFVQRQGQTMYFTGDILSGTGTQGNIYWGPGAPGATTADGRTNGLFRFSDFARSYTNFQNLTNGTAILEGGAGPAGSPSPIGTQGISLGDGNGGNMFSTNQEGANRRIFLTKPGSSYDRAMGAGGGTNSNLATVTINNVTPATYQPLYGNSGTVNLFNGYEFGGLNTTGTVTFTQNITGNNQNIPSSGTAAGAGGTNPVSIVHNFALTAATGGTVVFGGVISGSTKPVLGPLDVPGAIVTGNNARVTINQFRNHPNLDSNLDGLADVNANALVGTPVEGTVILSGFNLYGGGTEVMGGTLLINGSVGTGLEGDILTVNGAAQLGGTGSITGPVLLRDSAGLAFILNTDSASHDPMEIQGRLTMEGASTLTIRAEGLAAGPGLYSLVTTTDGISGTLPVLFLPAGWSGTAAINGNILQLNLTSVGGGAAGYDAWIAGFGLTGTDAAATADPDKDGLANLVEYVLGGTPNAAASALAPVSAPGTAAFNLTFKRTDRSETDTTLKVQIGMGLGPWPEEYIIGAAGGSAAGVTWTVTENGAADDDILITVPVTASHLRFARLMMTK